MMRALFIVPVRLYQMLIAPLLRPSCRFDPSCSNYFIEAVRVHGAARGPFLGVRRLLRCHPWGRWGYDPVPARKETTRRTDLQAKD